MSEQVNHPSHYCKTGRKKCIVEMEEKTDKKDCFKENSDLYLDIKEMLENGL